MGFNPATLTGSQDHVFNKIAHHGDCENRTRLLGKMTRKSRVLARQISDQCPEGLGRLVHEGKFFRGELTLTCGELQKDARGAIRPSEDRFNAGDKAPNFKRDRLWMKTAVNTDLITPIDTGLIRLRRIGGLSLNQFPDAE